MAAKTEYKPDAGPNTGISSPQTVYKMENQSPNTQGTQPNQTASLTAAASQGQSGNGPMPQHQVTNSQPQGGAGLQDAEKMSVLPDFSVPGENALSKMGDNHTIGRPSNPASPAGPNPDQREQQNTRQEEKQVAVQPGPQNSVPQLFKLSMAVDPADTSQYSPSRSPDAKVRTPTVSPSEMDEGPRGANGLAGYQPQQVAAPGFGLVQEVKPNWRDLPPNDPQQDSYSLIREGDSIVEKGERRGPRPNVPASTYGAPGLHAGTGGQANKKASHTVNMTGEYQIKGNKGLFATAEQPPEYSAFNPYATQSPPAQLTNSVAPQQESLYKAVSPGSESLYKAVPPDPQSLYKAVPPDPQSLYKAVPPAQQSMYKAPAAAARAEPEGIQQGTTQPLAAQQVVLQVNDPNVLSSPREEDGGHNDSNIANLSDSLNDGKDAKSVSNGQGKAGSSDGEGGRHQDTGGSKFQNDFGKYQKDEAGMSIFAPPDIDYQNRADKAEAHLLKYNTEVRGKLEIVLRGLQQIYSNIQKINLSSQESTNRFRTFFAGFLKKAESVAGSYHYKKDIRLLEEKKEMLELRTPGNLKTLASIFDNMRTQRDTWVDDIVRDIGRLKQSYQSKVVEENFFEEGIDKKSTMEMSKLIEKTFESALKRNKECLKEFDDINKKLEENKIYFEKNKKFKVDTFEGYIDYLRSVHKMWGFLSEAQERLVKYWERVKKMETMRIKAISGLLMEYIGIEERLTTPSRALDSLRKLNQAMSPENMAASQYNDKAFLNSAIFESLGFNMGSIDQFTQEIKRLKTRTPEIVEFALWDYMNTNMLVKNESKSVRIFRSNENYLYIYETKSREEVIMEKPVYKCKVNNLVLQFDNRNNFITLKGSGMFDFSSFSFNLREHQDAQDLVNYVVKFASNGQELLKAGIASNAQK